MTRRSTILTFRGGPSTGISGQLASSPSATRGDTPSVRVTLSLIYIDDQDIFDGAMSVVQAFPGPRTELSRKILMSLAARPATMADSLRHLRTSRRFQRLSVGRFFWEIDRLVDAGYLCPASDTLLETSGPASGGRCCRLARVRSWRLRARLQTARIHLDVHASMAESDFVSGGEES